MAGPDRLRKRGTAVRMMCQVLWEVAHPVWLSAGTVAFEPDALMEPPC